MGEAGESIETAAQPRLGPSQVVVTQEPRELVGDAGAAGPRAGAIVVACGSFERYASSVAVSCAHLDAGEMRGSEAPEVRIGRVLGGVCFARSETALQQIPFRGPIVRVLGLVAKLQAPVALDDRDCPDDRRRPAR